MDTGYGFQKGAAGRASFGFGLPVVYETCKICYNYNRKPMWGTLARLELLCYTEGMSTHAGLAARLTLPLPPSINQQYATVNGRRVLSKESRVFKKEVAQIVRHMRAKGVLSDDLVACLRQGFIALFIDFFFETPGRRDLDGGLKITQDAICEALDINDNRVVDVHLVKRIDPLRPRIEVELEALPNWQFDTQYVYLGG
jgi:crossover junction endodeoxyribonuclease RusA